MSKKNIWIWVIVISIVAIFVVIFVISNKRMAVNENQYSVGVIVPLSGGASNIGVPFSKGMQIAVDEVNGLGGINGKKVILGIQDGEFSGTKSISAAKQLLATINPDAFDVLFALPAQALSPVFKDSKKPFLEWDYSRNVVSDNDYAFKTGFDAITGCEDLVNYAKNQKLYKKIGVLMSKTPYNQNCFEGAKKADSSISEYWYDFGSDDFRTLLSKVHQDGVDTIVTIPIDPEPVRLFKQLSDLQYPIRVICFTSSECIYPQVVNSASQKTLEGTLSVDFIPENLLQSPFADLFRSKYPNDNSKTTITWAAQGYDDMSIIIAAMKNCSPKDSDCLTKSLSEVKDYASVIGSNGFNDRIQNLTMVKQIYQNGKWVNLTE